MQSKHAEKCAAAAREIDEKLPKLPIIRYRIRNSSTFQIGVMATGKYEVTIPKGGTFVVSMSEANRWQRLWFRFIGWGVDPVESQQHSSKGTANT